MSPSSRARGAVTCPSGSPRPSEGDLPKPVYRGSTDLKAESHKVCPTKLKHALDKQGDRGVSLIFLFLLPISLFFLKLVFLLSSPEVGGFLKTLFSEGIFSIRL